MPLVPRALGQSRLGVLAEGGTEDSARAREEPHPATRGENRVDGSLWWPAPSEVSGGAGVAQVRVGQRRTTSAPSLRSQGALRRGQLGAFTPTTRAFTRGDY